MFNVLQTAFLVYFMVAPLSAYSLRKMEIADAQAVVNLTEACWKESYRGIVDQKFLDDFPYEAFLEGRKSFLHNILSNSLYSALVAVDDETGKIVGFADAGPRRENPEDGPAGEISALYVDPSCQRKGIGKALFLAQKDFLRGYPKLIVWTFEANHVSRRFYEKHAGSFEGSGVKEIAGKQYPSVRYSWLLEEPQP